MIYNDTGSGGIKVSGCPILSDSHYYETSYDIGDVLYSEEKARHGILEKVVIKQIVPTNVALTGGQYHVLYRDTFNALWNDGELVSFSIAEDMAEDYHTDLLLRLAALHASTCS